MFVRAMPLLMAASLLIVAGCGAGKSPQGKAPATPGAMVGGATQTPCAGHVTVSINYSAFWQSMPAGTGLLSYVPRQGEKFLVVQAQLAVDGSMPVQVDESNFRLVDDAGREYAQTALFAATERLTGTVNPGAALTGKMGFSVPESITSARLQFKGCGSDELVVPPQ